MAIGAYNARCWAEARMEAEIHDEIARSEQQALRTRDWQEAGNATDDWARVDTLYAILIERGVEKPKPLPEPVRDSRYYRMKADQEWDMAGLARQDGDMKAAQQHTAKAREYELHHIGM